jgi:soluble lytic murein transglycosylase
MWKLGNKAVLQELLKNPRVNFYTLYAYEEVNKKFFIKNKIIYNSIKNPKYDQTNPWDVLKFYDEFKKREDLFSFAKELDSNKSIALKALVLDKAFKFKCNIFITPKMYDDKNITFKSYVYAIARQESRFIPASVSRSYALGTMQIMPFLVRDYNSNVFKQFDYNENIKLGVKHLKWLFSKLKDPIMVAYAYNAGIGFVNNKIKPYFKYKGKYEPFLSMELVHFNESREYGKKVIANFVIYNHLFLDNNLTLHSLLKK